MKDSGECRVHTTEGTSQQNLAAGQAVLNARHSPELVKPGQGRNSKDMADSSDICSLCRLFLVAIAMAAVMYGCEGDKHSSADEPKAEIVSEKEAKRVLKNLLNGL